MNEMGWGCFEWLMPGRYIYFQITLEADMTRLHLSESADWDSSSKRVKIINMLDKHGGRPIPTGGLSQPWMGSLRDVNRSVDQWKCVETA